MQMERETVVNLDEGDNIVVRFGKREVNIEVDVTGNMSITSRDTFLLRWGNHEQESNPDGDTMPERIVPNVNEEIASFDVVATERN